MKTRAWVATSLAWLLLASACGGGGGDEPDWILVGGVVLTGEDDAPRAEALAVKDGRIVGVGPRSLIEAMAGPATRLEDLRGHVVVPGLVDAHGHVLGLGFSLRRVELRGAGTYAALIRRAADRAAEQEPGSWILGRGWDQTLWEGGEFPHHRELSAAVPHHPVLLDRVDGHAALANEAALVLAGINRDTPDPPGGRIFHDAEGLPTGVLIDNAIGLVEAHVTPPSRAEQLEALDLAVHHLAALGLTGVHDAGVGYNPTLGLADPQDPGWGMVDLYRELLAAGRLPIRVYVMLGGNGASPGQEAYFARPPVLGEGDGMITVRAIKVGVDGALGSRGAALVEPYTDRPGTRGLLLRDQATLDRLMSRAFADGWQVAVHAIGDRANRMVLDAVEKARRDHPDVADTRPRVEHAQVLRPVDIPRFARLGVIASVQPTHATSDRRWAATRLGEERLQGAYAYGSLAGAGAVLACGSDFPVENADPLAGLQAAVARTDARGEPEGGWRLQEALSPAAALACFTRGPAYAAFMEDETGRLAVGLRADFTVLDGDPLTVDAGTLSALKVVRTVVGGRTTYQASSP